jgi:predicted nucleic acid-binding protein
MNCCGCYARNFNGTHSFCEKTEADIRLYAHYVTPAQTVTAIITDPSDNRVLECAVEASSDFIVSGDKTDVLPLGSYAGIRIITVAEFMELMDRATRTN